MPLWFAIATLPTIVLQIVAPTLDGLATNFQMTLGVSLWILN